MSEKNKWYQQTWAIILLLILFFPVGLFLMWKYAGWNKIVKGIITGIFVILIIGSMGKDSTSNPATTQTEQPQEQAANNKQNETAKAVEAAPQEEIYKIGEKIQGKTLEVTVTGNLEKDSVGGQYFNEKASEGATLVVINWQYKNTSDKPAKSYSKPDIKLVDANGTEYDSDLGKTSIYATEVKLDRKVWSDLNPGITVKDAEVFEVGKESFSTETWFIQIKLDGNKYKVALN